MSITGCVLVKNEASLLAGCLASIKDLVQEIIVIDNGSTDASVEVANSFGCKVIHSPETVFDRNRNLFFKEATCPWLFIIDADERITKECHPVIHAAIKGAPEDVMAFYLPRFEYLGEGKWSMIRLPRLIRNHPEIYYNNFLVHSSPSLSIKKLNGKTSNLYAPIHHLDLLLKGRTENKRKRNLKLLREDIAQPHPSSELGFLYCFLGLEHTAIGQLDAAESFYKKAIKLQGDALSFALTLLAQNYLAKEDLSSVESVASEIISMNEHFTVPALILMAEIAYRRAKISDALQFCQKAMVYDPQAPHLFINMAALLENTDPLRAIELINTATQLNPYLLETAIYYPGEAPNLFQHQISFLTCVKTINAHLQQCKKNLKT